MTLHQAIKHAQYLADLDHWVITVFRSGYPVPTWDFGVCYVDTPTAVYNALPSCYFSPRKAAYRASMMDCRLLSNIPEVSA